MENPFEEISQRLLRIESLLLNLQSQKESYKNPDKDGFLDIKEAAEFLKEAKATLYSRTCRREIPFYKQNKRLYFKKSELVSWLEKGKKRTEEEILGGY